MQRILTVDSPIKFLSLLANLLSLALMVSGVYFQSYWGGFGLVLFMTTLLLVLSLSFSSERA